MKIEEERWDKKHLNLNVVKVEFEQKDTINSLRNEEIECYDYVIAKVPIRELELTHLLEHNGFRFLETQFELVLDSRKPCAMPKYFEKILNEISYKKITRYQNVERIINRIDENFSDSDRVSLDPFFSRNIGAKRYRNWIRDEYNGEKSTLFELFLKERPIGFFLLKRIDTKSYLALLAGLYPEFKNSGLGISVVAKPIDWAIQNRIVTLVTRNSSNNLQSLKIHLECGYTIQRINYVLRKVNH
jgi:hypothetical protein